MAHTRKAAVRIIDELQEKLKDQDIALAKRLEWIRKVEAEKADLLAALKAIAASDTGKREQRGGATPSRYYVLSEKQVADMTTAITKAENA
jgi:hypothetical protein